MCTLPAKSFLFNCVVCCISAPCKQSPGTCCNSMHVCKTQLNLPMATSHAALVEPAGYALEEHTVHTADGYLLAIYRMPFARGERVSSMPMAPSNRYANPVSYCGMLHAYQGLMMQCMRSAMSELIALQP